MTTYTVPGAFYDDHVARDLPAGTNPRRMPGNLVRVDMTDDEASELLSDAAYYADAGTAVFGTGFVGLVSSARATVKRLTDQGVT